VRAALRAGADDPAIAALLHAALFRKGRGGAIDILESQTALPLSRTMHQIGG
jgi:hypothetical protein